MIASILSLSRTECQTLKITDAYSLHRVVYSLFPPQASGGRDFLFADKGGDFHGRKILILSRKAPVDPGWGQIASKEIPDSFLSHTMYGFEVRMNPTKREKSSGKTIAIRGKAELLAWFSEKAPEQYGFEIIKDDQGNPLVQVQGIGVQTFGKGKSLVTHGEATFIGKLRVVEPERFRESFEEGLGRAKGFGFGLLQIVPLLN